MKVSIYSTHFNRPELLESQYTGFLKYCKDDNFKYIVINNGINLESRQTIKQFCEINSIQEIEIYDNDKVLMTAMNHKFALQYCYDNYIAKDNSEIRVVVDSDVIPFTDFKFFDILGENQIAGIQMDYGIEGYIASFISIYGKEVVLDLDLGKHMEIDSGIATHNLVKKYKTKFIDHTAPMRREEGDYVFKNRSKNSISYDESFGIQFICGCFLHHYRGSGWDNGDENYYARKKEFIDDFLKNKDSYSPILDSIVQYDHAHMDQWIRKENYPLYKLINNL